MAFTAAPAPPAQRPPVVAGARSRATRPWFYTWMGGVALLAVAIGFGVTYAAPMVRGTFQAPTAVHVHGAFAMAWVLLFVTQPLLVRFGGVRLHRRLGRIGLPLAVGVAVTMIPAGMFQVARDEAAGGGPVAVSAILGISDLWRAVPRCSSPPVSSRAATARPTAAGCCSPRWW